MTDISLLSLEEELDALLPIYILGQSKEWDFLSPEQVKKLVDNDRLRWTNSGFYEAVGFEKLGEIKRDNPSLMVDVFMSLLINAFEKALIEKLHYCPVEEWESKDDNAKRVVDNLVFYVTFRIKLDELSEKMFNAYSGIYKWNKFRVLKIESRPAKCAPNTGDSAHIPSIFLLLSLFLAGRLCRPHSNVYINIDCVVHHKHASAI